MGNMPLRLVTWLPLIKDAKKLISSNFVLIVIGKIFVYPWS